MMGSEVWVSIAGFEGFYEVSSLGRARSLPREFVDSLGRRRSFGGQVLKSPIGRGSYPSVSLRRKGYRIAGQIHVLVADAFVAGRKPGLEVCHINGNKFDIRASNLRWGTRSSNILDEVAHGTHRNSRKTHCPKMHPYSGANLHTKPNGDRECRECMRARARKNRSQNAQ